MKTKTLFPLASLFFRFALAAAICFTACQPPAPADALTQEQVKTLLDKVVQMWNTSDANLADEILSADYKRVSSLGTTNNPDEFKQELARVNATWPDFQLTINESYIKGDKVFTLCTWKGTNTGPLGENIPATGKATSFDGMNITTVKDGKLIEDKSYWDQLASNLKLGFTLMPPQMPAATESEGAVK